LGILVAVATQAVAVVVVPMVLGVAQGTLAVLAVLVEIFLCGWDNLLEPPTRAAVVVVLAGQATVVALAELAEAVPVGKVHQHQLVDQERPTAAVAAVEGAVLVHKSEALVDPELFT